MLRALMVFLLLLFISEPAWGRQERATAPTEARLLELAARIGEGLPWAQDWKEAAARAKKERRLIVLFLRWQAGFDIPLSESLRSFADEDVRALLVERFVLLHLLRETETPLRLPARYGLGPASFGASTLVVTPEGEVLADTMTVVEPAWLLEFLQTALDQRPEFSGAVVTEKEPLAGAARLLRRGEVEEAFARLGEPKSAEGFRLRAALYARTRDGSAAFEELGRARAMADGAGEAAARIDLDEAIVLARLGRFADSLARLQKLETAEARFWRGGLERRLGQSDAARATWDQLVQDHADDPWAWRAAADRTSLSFRLGGIEAIEWPDETMLATLAIPTWAPLPADQWRKAQTDAVRWLLAAQRSDGSWLNPSELESRAAFADYVDPISLATTVIAGQALLRQRAEPAARAAARRAFDHLLAQQVKLRRSPVPAAFMDYWPWTFAYELWFIADGLDAGLFTRDELGPLPAEIFAALRARRCGSGGFSYYLSSDLSQSNLQPPQESITFVTAAVVAGMQRARSAGLEVPPDLLEKALDSLEHACAADGSIEYFDRPDADLSQRSTIGPGAAGRGPLTAWVLSKAKRCDDRALNAALARFFDHLADLVHERGKTVMHAGLNGLGCHYILFDLATAAHALATLPAAKSKAWRATLREKVLKTRVADGSCLDTPVLGRPYGTAMALIALDLLDDSAKRTAR